MNQKTILLVEDNEDDEVLTLRALNRSDLLARVDVVRDGLEALDYLMCQGKYADRDCSAQPHLILLDFKLPKLDGADVVKAIRENVQSRHIPIVMLSTSIEENDLVRCYDNGANSYVKKPLDFNEFMQIVTLLGVYWLTINNLPQG
jgi:two-component system response regulator